MQITPEITFHDLERSDWMYSLGSQPLLRKLRGEPQFEAVVAKLGLPR